MLCFKSSIPVDHHMNMTKSEQFNQRNNSSKKTPISDCEQSRSALIDFIISIAVIGACGFLIYPYITLLLIETLEILKPIICVIQQEYSSSPMVYGCLVLTIFTTSMAVLAITSCTGRKCGRSGCRGLQKPAEFEIEIETEDRLKNSNSNSIKRGSRTGVFELERDYFREIEYELKKMAPVNGRAILVLRARCGCSVGRMEVPGSKKSNRKMK